MAKTPGLSSPHTSESQTVEIFFIITLLVQISGKRPEDCSLKYLIGKDDLAAS